MDLHSILGSWKNETLLPIVVQTASTCPLVSALCGYVYSMIHEISTASAEPAARAVEAARLFHRVSQYHWSTRKKDIHIVLIYDDLCMFLLPIYGKLCLLLLYVMFAECWFMMNSMHLLLGKTLRIT